MQVFYHKHFLGQYRKLPRKLQERFNRRLILFLGNPFDPELNNHALHGKYSGCRSIDIAGDLRAIYEINGNSVNFVLIGTHDALYS